MKKNLIITFDIYQDTLDNQKPDFTVYSEASPNDNNKIEIKELNNLGLKKMAKFSPEKKDIMDKLGRKYIVRITEDKLKELLNFN